MMEYIIVFALGLFVGRWLARVRKASDVVDVRRFNEGQTRKE